MLIGQVGSRHAQGPPAARNDCGKIRWIAVGSCISRAPPLPLRSPLFSCSSVNCAEDRRGKHPRSGSGERPGRCLDDAVIGAGDKDGFTVQLWLAHLDRRQSDLTISFARTPRSGRQDRPGFCPSAVPGSASPLPLSFRGPHSCHLLMRPSSANAAPGCRAGDRLFRRFWVVVTGL